MTWMRKPVAHAVGGQKYAGGIFFGRGLTLCSQSSQERAAIEGN